MRSLQRFLALRGRLHLTSTGLPTHLRTVSCRQLVTCQEEVRLRSNLDSCVPSVTHREPGADLLWDTNRNWEMPGRGEAASDLPSGAAPRDPLQTPQLGSAAGGWPRGSWSASAGQEWLVSTGRIQGAREGRGHGTGVHL